MAAFRCCYSDNMETKMETLAQRRRMIAHWLSELRKCSGDMTQTELQELEVTSHIQRI